MEYSLEQFVWKYFQIHNLIDPLFFFLSFYYKITYDP